MKELSSSLSFLPQPTALKQLLFLVSWRCYEKARVAAGRTVSDFASARFSELFFPLTGPAFSGNKGTMS
jgi:hypothetical protein